MTAKKTPTPTKPTAKPKPKSEPGKYAGVPTEWRTAREAQGLSRKQLADKLGWKLATTWAIETGQREATTEEAAALRKALGGTNVRKLAPKKATAKKSPTKRATTTDAQAS